MDKINLLVIGSAGFMYSNFIRYMLKNFSEYKISSIDAIKNKKLLNTIYANKAHDFYLGDITDAHFVNNIFEIEKPDIVIHGASEYNYPVTNILNTNIIGTQILLEAAQKYNVKKFIYTSSDEVYGSLNSENDLSFTEISTVNPQNIDSISKVSSEFLIKNSFENLNYIIVRPCNNYGPRQLSEYLIPNLIKGILNNEKCYTLNFNPMQINNWIHVQDYCSALKTIIEKGEMNSIYNISSGYEFNNLEVCNEIFNIMEKNIELKFYNEFSIKKGNRYSIDNKKLKNLGWKPEFKFKGIDGGLHHTCNWYKNNSWFLR